MGAGALFGMRLAVGLAPGWTVEAAYGYASFEVEGTLNTILEPEGTRRKLLEDELHHWDVTVRRSFDDPAGLRPFVTAGLGATSATARFPPPGGPPDAPPFEPPGPTESSETRLRGILGAGLTRALGSRWSLRLDARAHLRSCDDLCAEDGTLTDVELSGGLEIHI